jgi:cyclopropane fatty-acyl-phospholipid synthase-like methyltransferase
MKVLFRTASRLAKGSKRFLEVVLRWLQFHPIAGPAGLTFFILVLIYVVRWFFLANPSIPDLLAITGLTFSALGYLITYLQLRDNNSRIVGYDEFYQSADKLFKEIEIGKATEFFFYGPTILPGNVAVGEADPNVRKFREDLDDLFSKRIKYNKAARPLIIVPPIRDYEKSYLPFLTTRMNHFPKEQSQNDWEAFVKERQKEASDFQRDLRTEFGIRLEPKDLRDISAAYFLSNGKRVIFAKPLHYTVARKSADEKQRHSPYLIGFTSTDSATIDAFQESFEKLGIDPGTSLARDQLQWMYSKHIITPRYLDECIRGLHPLTVDTLAAHDHDHFGGKATTDKFCAFLKDTETALREKPEGPARAIHVLDIGSGFGGPARYIAEKCNCSVDGLELQTDRYDWAVRMTERLNWHDRVQFSNVNAYTEIRDMTKKYDYAVAFLSILHFPNKEDFLKVLGERIETGGKVYIEDYVLGRDDELKEREKSGLLEFISCPLLLSIQEYESCLAEGGLRVEVAENTTDGWEGIAKERVEAFERDKSKHIERSGKAAFEKAQAFNRKVVELYEAKVIAGRRIIATKT